MKYQGYPEYKDSGVEWFGTVPDPWISTRLKFEALINMGQSPNSDDCNQDGYGLPFLQGNAEFGDRSPSPKQYCDIPRKIATEGQLLFSVRAPVGALNIADQKYGIGRGLCAIASNERIASDFLWWLIPVVKSELNSVSTGSTFEAVSVEQVENVVFFRPPIFEQEKIASFLNHEAAKIDTLIEKQQQLIKLLKEKRQAVISHAVTKGLNPDAPMRDSGVEWLGEVPEHWEVICIKHLSSVKRGASPRPIDDPKYFNEDGEYAWVRIADVSKAGMYLTFTTQRLSELGASLSVKLEPNQLFISIAGTVGKPCLTISRVCIHDGFVYFPNLSINNKFVYYIFEAGEAYLGLGKMGTQLNLNTETVGEIKIGLPPAHEIELVIESIEQANKKYDDLISRANYSIDLMQERRTALISAAVTGKIDVRNWQAPELLHNNKETHKEEAT